MLSGTRGAKYGLQLPGARKGAEVKGAGVRSIQAKKPSIFSEDSDEENVESEIARQAAKKRSDKELEQQHAVALKEDPNIFDYDGVYDEMKQAQAQPALKQVQRQPRYIESLLKKAKEREKAQEVVMERKIHKEQAAEAHLYGDKEKFVTGAYKRKLAEDAKWREEERRREEVEKANEVTKKGDLSDFYRNLLNKNEAFGGGARAVIAPRSEQAAAPESERIGGAAPHAEATDGSDMRAAVASMPSQDGRQSDERGNLSTREVRETKSALDDDEHQQQGADMAENVLQRRPNLGDQSKDIGEALDGRERSKTEVSKVDGVSAAKARYLARKKQKT